MKKNEEEGLDNNLQFEGESLHINMSGKNKI